MKKIKIIDVKSNESLYRVASALGELTLMRKIALDNGAEEPKPIKRSMDAIMDVLTYKFQKVFIDEFPQYADNKMTVGEDSDGIKVKVYDEILEEGCDDCECDDCECDDSMDISEMLKNSGLETSDDHVERLADDLRNKRGGRA